MRKFCFAIICLSFVGLLGGCDKDSGKSGTGQNSIPDPNKGQGLPPAPTLGK